MPGPVVAPPQAPQIIQTPTPIHVARYARNGLVPHAVYESEIASSLNFAAAVRTKQLFSGGCAVNAIPSSDIVPRVRWRFAAHTGPLLGKIWCRVLLARADKASGGGGASTVTLYLTNADGSTVYGSGLYARGGNGSGAAVTDTPDEYAQGDIEIFGVPADTDVYGYIEDGIGARVISACVYEESLPLYAANGYVVPSQCAATMPIYDARRKTMYELATRLWKRGAAHLFNWTVDKQSSPRTINNGIAKNIIDNTSTIVSTATPGPTIDLRYCRTRARSTVPCVFAVYASMSGAADTGEVYLMDSTATPLATISISGTAAKWYTVAVDLPATLAKYDLQFGNPDALETLSVGAASLYQYQ